MQIQPTRIFHVVKQNQKLRPASRLRCPWLRERCARPADRSTPEAAVMTGYGRGGRERRDILLVEDSLADARLALETFADCAPGWAIIHVRDGASALAYLRDCLGDGGERLPRLILLDLNLPGRSGRDVLAEIKADPALKPIPVIMLSTSTAEQDILHCYALHANAYVAKPVDLVAFQRVAEAIRRFWLETAESV
jgi:chemotaxis family two-component system response regulator Rcp1